MLPHAGSPGCLGATQRVLGPGVRALVKDPILTHTAAWPTLTSGPVCSHGLVLPALQLQRGDELTWNVCAAQMWGDLLADTHS